MWLRALPTRMTTFDSLKCLWIDFCHPAKLLQYSMECTLTSPMSSSSAHMLSDFVKNLFPVQFLSFILFKKRSKIVLLSLLAFVVLRVQLNWKILRVKVPAVLYKTVAKEWEQTYRGLMKYLRFWLKGSTKKVHNKRGAPRASIVLGPGGNRGQVATDIRRAHIEQGCVGSAHSCVTVLPPQPPAPCLCELLRGPRRFDFTLSWLHSNGFVSATRRHRLIPDHRRSLTWHRKNTQTCAFIQNSSAHTEAVFLKMMIWQKSPRPLSQGVEINYVLVAWGTRGDLSI